MTPIVSIVGKSDSGKTSLIEVLITQLTEKDVNVATIKHDVHGFSIDKPGKDTWRHKQSGARTVIISSPEKIAMIKDVEKEHSLDQLREKYLTDVDLILTEGYKSSDKPKIEVLRPEKYSQPLCEPGDDDLVYTVINRESEDGNPNFKEEDLNKVLEILFNDFLAGEGDYN